MQIQSDAILVSLATSIGLTIVITLSFCFLRPYNTYVYAPRLKNAGIGRAPPPLQRGFFAWVKPIVTIHENDYLEVVGPDAAIFLRFASMCRNIFVALTIFGCAIIIPINILAGKDFYNKFDGVPILAKITPLYVFGEAAWAYVACAYIFDAIVAGFLWANYKAVVQLRRKHFESKNYQNSLHARTVLVSNRTPLSLMLVDVVRSQAFPRAREMLIILSGLSVFFVARHTFCRRTLPMTLRSFWILLENMMVPCEGSNII